MPYSIRHSTCTLYRCKWGAQSWLFVLYQATEVFMNASPVGLLFNGLALNQTRSLFMHALIAYIELRGEKNIRTREKKNTAMQTEFGLIVRHVDESEVFWICMCVSFFSGFSWVLQCKSDIILFRSRKSLHVLLNSFLIFLVVFFNSSAVCCEFVCFSFLLILIRVFCYCPDSIRSI